MCSWTIIASLLVIKKNNNKSLNFERSTITNVEINASYSLQIVNRLHNFCSPTSCCVCVFSLLSLKLLHISDISMFQVLLNSSAMFKLFIYSIASQQIYADNYVP